MLALRGGVVVQVAVSDEMNFNRVKLIKNKANAKKK